MPRLRITGGIHPLPTHAFTAYTQTTFSALSETEVLSELKKLISLSQKLINDRGLLSNFYLFAN